MLLDVTFRNEEHTSAIRNPPCNPAVVATASDSGQAISQPIPDPTNPRIGARYIVVTPSLSVKPPRASVKE